MNRNIQSIKSMLAKGVFEKEALLDVLGSYGEDVAVIPVMLLQHQKVLRTRQNETDFFCYVRELSYPPAECARTDRASLKGEPMFYASAFTKNADITNAYPRIVSALETIPLLRDIGAFGAKVMTQSVWMVNEPIHAFSFPLSEKYKRACDEIGMLNTGWNELVRSNYSEESIEFFTYIGDLMAEPQSSCLYDITATCVDYVLNHFPFEGVMYPSVPMEGQGLNICIKPIVVDQKCSFAGAATEAILRNGDKSEIHIIANTNMVSPDAFEWIVTTEGKILMINCGMMRKEMMSSDIVIRSEALMDRKYL